MLDLVLVPLSFGFFSRALLVGALIALVAALVGTHLTFKGFSMIGDGLSHVGFGMVAIAAAVGIAPLAVAVPTVILAAFLLLSVARRNSHTADTSIAMLSAVGLAVGMVAVSLSGTAFDLNSYLFGSVLAVSSTDAATLLVLCALLLILYLLCFPAFFSLTADEEFFDAKTRRAIFFRSLLAAMAAVIVVLGMQSVGALLISALLIFPPCAARCLARSFRATVLCSAVFGVCAFVTGLFLSYHLNLPAGAAVVLTNAALYLVCLLLARLKTKRES